MENPVYKIPFIFFQFHFIVIQQHGFVVRPGKKCRCKKPLTEYIFPIGKIHFIKMAQSKNQLWVHAVWTTKDRLLLIPPHIDRYLYHFILKQLVALKCSDVCINGMPDHVHVMFAINLNLPVSRIMQQIKGSSSHYLSTEFGLKHFSWQRGYAIFSVSRSEVRVIRKYIENQKQHHAKNIKYR